MGFDNEIKVIKVFKRSLVKKKYHGLLPAQFFPQDDLIFHILHIKKPVILFCTSFGWTFESVTCGYILSRNKRPVAMLEGSRSGLMAILLPNSCWYSYNIFRTLLPRKRSVDCEIHNNAIGWSSEELGYSCNILFRSLHIALDGT